ncbi:MAG: hypothetical protein EOP04_29785 [Proteobacteria bacterium]|nr:MAG: hypothetical protein EOP04_29785 [Pseudomonadota bacterium]
MSKKLLALTISTFVAASIAHAGGGPTEKISDCKPGKIVTGPAPKSMTEFNKMSVITSLPNGNTLGVDLNVHIEGRTVSQNGDCEKQIVNEGTQKIYALLREINPKNLQVLSTTEITANQPKGTNFRVILSEGKPVGFEYMDVSSGDELAVRCVQQGDEREGLASLRGKLNGNVLDKKNVDCDLN